MSLETKHAILDALQTVLDADHAQAVLDHRKGKKTKTPFNLYRAGLVVDQMRRAKDRSALVMEMTRLEENKHELSVEYLRGTMIYDPLSGEFTRRSNGASRGSINNQGYIIFSVAGRSYLAHRLAWFYMHGRWPVEQLDHIDRDKSNNRIANLREATNQENCWNMGPQRNSATGIRGVHWDSRRGQWMATMQIDGKTKYLGRFKNIADAAKAYGCAEAHHRGNFLEAHQ